MNKYLLKDISKIDISSVDKKIKENEKPIRLCNFVDVYNNWAISKKMYDSFMKATANKNEISRYKLKKGMIAITKDSETRDDIGMSTYIADTFDDVILGYHTALIIPNSNIVDSRYLNAYLNSTLGRKHFSNSASGSGQRYTLTIESIGNLAVYLPNLNTQIKIGNLLAEIDRKIENNAHINNNLEELMKTLYQRWFIEFNFPNEDGKPYKSSGGKMVWNEELKQEIPEGWKVLSIKNVLNVITGKEDANFSTKNGKYKFFTCSNDILKCDVPAFNGKAVLIAGNGDFNVKYYDGEFNAYQRTYVLMPEDEKYIGEIYLNAINTINKFKKGSNGSIVKFITKGDVENIKILIPQDNRLLFELNKKLDQIQHFKKENEDLAELRDFLLPMLMNGQINVDDVEI